MARENRMLGQHRRTLFSKYLQISLAIVLVSFLILGVMLVFLSRGIRKTTNASCLQKTLIPLRI